MQLWSQCLIIQKHRLEYSLDTPNMQLDFFPLSMFTVSKHTFNTIVCLCSRPNVNVQTLGDVLTHHGVFGLLVLDFRQSKHTYRTSSSTDILVLNNLSSKMLTHVIKALFKQQDIVVIDFFLNLVQLFTILSYYFSFHVALPTGQLSTHVNVWWKHTTYTT